MSDPDYSGDNHDRTGYIVAIDVQKDGYQMMISDPAGCPIQTYRVADTPRAVARMLEEWLCGYAPRIRDRLDRSARFPFDAKRTVPRSHAVLGFVGHGDSFQ
jgi:hypothetical protein